MLSPPEGNWDDEAESEVRRKLGREEDVRTVRECVSHAPENAKEEDTAWSNIAIAYVASGTTPVALHDQSLVALLRWRAAPSVFV